MAIKKMNIEEFKGFGRRLITVAREHGFIDAKDLAQAIYENPRCRKMVCLRNNKKENILASPDGPGTEMKKEIKKIQRLVQKHLTPEFEKPEKVPGEYMLAYSIVLDCSIDYLFGKTDIKSADLEIVDICHKIGLSENAVNCLIEHHPKEKTESLDCDVFSISSWWSELLTEYSFSEIPMAWLEYAMKIVEMNDIDKEIRAAERAEQEIPFNDIYYTLIFNEDLDHKSLRIKKSELEDSFLGAQHRMLFCIEKYLIEYADLWAEKQHLDYEERCYDEILAKRKAIKEHGLDIDR